MTQDSLVHLSNLRKTLLPKESQCHIYKSKSPLWRQVVTGQRYRVAHLDHDSPLLKEVNQFTLRKYLIIVTISSSLRGPPIVAGALRQMKSE